VSGGSTAPKTYYSVKDISYLAHEPLLARFRQFKTFAKKLKKILVKQSVKDAREYEKTNKPVYTLDHLIRERCVGCAYSCSHTFILVEC
jgi:pescadillo protein